MGLFDWAAAPKADILYIDDHGDQHRLTAVQYGQMCVEWATSKGRLKSQELVAFGKIRNDPDIIAKISQVPFIAVAHGTAFFIAVYCTYPVIRLGISNELFKGVMQGVSNSILSGSIFSKGQPTSPEYLSQLVSEVSQYTAILLKTAGMANQPDQDRMLFGVGGACQLFLAALDQEYAGVVVLQDSVDNDELTNKTTKPADFNSGNELHKSPLIKETRNIDTASIAECVNTDTSAENFGQLSEDEIATWFDNHARPLLLVHMANKLGLIEPCSDSERAVVARIADSYRELLIKLSSKEPVMLEEGVKTKLNLSLEVTGRGDSMTTRLKNKLADIPCFPPKPKPVPEPKVKSQNPYIEATRSKDSQTLLLLTFANAAAEFVKGIDGRRSLVLLQ